MRYSILTICLTFLFTINLFPSNLDSLPSFLQLPAGIPVSLSLNENINSDHSEVGQTIELLVRNQVYWKGRKIIAKGQVAEGIVQFTVKSCSGPCGFHQAEVTIIATRVQTVTGETIYLKGIPFTQKGNGYTPSSAIIKIGTVLRSRILNNKKLRL